MVGHSHLNTAPATKKLQLGDEQRPCQECYTRGFSCSSDDDVGFVAREWDPEDAGFSSTDLQDALNSVQNSFALSEMSFIDENTTVENQYVIVNDDDQLLPLNRDSTFQNTSTPPSAILSSSVLASEPLGLRACAKTAFFLDRYCHIIGPWFDLFDKERHFSSIVPHLSLNYEVLHLSCLACAARQHYLTTTEHGDIALSYYNDALQKLTAELAYVSTSSSAAIFASCLLLAHCEMIGASTSDWHLHLSGTYSLVTAHGFNSRTGGLGQACFWIYCRMDLLSSLATSESTRLDTSTWILGSDPRRPEKEAWAVDQWANHVVLLLAQVHNFLCKVRKEITFSQELFTSWQDLQAHLELHEQRQPLECQPLVTYAGPEKDGNLFPFSLYINETVSAAMQMFNLARFLLILARPERSRQERASRFERQGEIARIYATRVVANSISNRHAINWATAVQLLNIAGYALVDWAERKALLVCLEDNRVQTGWNTRRNIQNLLDWWGWNAALQQDGWTWKNIQAENVPCVTIKENLLRFFDINLA
ncbi:hypothetical protein V495_05892 [Pseudogymnoascus sp. VKM F-4514 (FW-929)]|nr:hypothetical protein V495_05892 [Pseudogymnoascus sp. VKM F-4514 (FW-929)]KFY56082.1 hypothetical protein V497_06531 [Pseudogymnoascus sp. VKM F-4516 (FW-969)]